MAAIDHRGRPVDLPRRVQRPQQLVMKTLPNARLLPGGEPAMRRRRRAAHLAGQMPPRDPRDQHEDDRVETNTVIDPRTPTPRIGTMLGKQRVHHLPQIVTHLPGCYVPLLMSVPGIAWVLGYTIASEIGDIQRFASPKKLCGYSGLCPRVYQSGAKDRRGQLTHAGPKYLRWALMEAAVHACRHPVYGERYERNKRRLGKQRGAKVAQVDLARRLAHAIWHMLSRKEKFAPRGAAFRLAA